MMQLRFLFGVLPHLYLRNIQQDFSLQKYLKQSFFLEFFSIHDGINNVEKKVSDTNGASTTNDSLVFIINSNKSPNWRNTPMYSFKDNEGGGGSNQRQILSLIHCTKSEQTNVASGKRNGLHVRHLLDSTVSKCGWLSKSDSLDLFSATAGGFWVKVLWWRWRHRCYENHKNNHLNYDKFIFAETWLTWLGARNAGR